MQTCEYAVPWSNVIKIYIILERFSGCFFESYAHSEFCDIDEIILPIFNNSSTNENYLHQE